MSLEPPIATLCGLLGVETDYIDSAGVRRTSPRATLVALLAALGYPAATAHEAAASIELFHQRAVAQLVEPVAVCRDDAPPPAMVVTLPAPAGNASLHWELRQEAGGVSHGTVRFAALPLLETITVAGHAYERRHLELPTSPPLGYHRLRIETADSAGEAVLIMVPRSAYQPASLDTGRGIWGIALQLYGLRSGRNWGIGDLTDLGDVLRQAAAAGAGAVGLNPLHALFLDDPAAASPYSPSSRLFANPLYLDVESIVDFAECADARALVATAEFQAALARLRGGELVDYPQVADRKFRVLEQLYGSFRTRHIAADDARAREFRAFQSRRGRPLNRFAVFQALREHVARMQPDWQCWQHWPAAFRDPASPVVERFAQENVERVEFFAYLQWQFDHQLSGCVAIARQSGLPIGLYHDLAVGVNANGADAWLDQEAIVAGWSIGAPPDPWALKGQSWGLPPLHPVALRALAYQPLIETLRANMRHAGALRIDHILGFRRLFWIPAGAPADQGAYVRYPLADMLGILALESQRHRCLVIGEDLGTLPEGMHAALAEAGILSYRLLYFERDADNALPQPDAFPRAALVAVGTHDLPTLPAYWAADDIALRASFGAYANEADRRADLAQRETDRRLLTAGLRRAGVLGQDDPAAAAPPVEAAYRFLARTPSRVLMVHLEDALGVRTQINLPGTVDEHPNWRRRLPLAVAELFHEQRVCHLLDMLAQERPPVDGGGPQ